MGRAAAQPQALPVGKLGLGSSVVFNLWPLIKAAIQAAPFL